MNVEKYEVLNNIEDVEKTTPLSDVRRTRVKSTGRPPSQCFLKENALHRCVSLECEEVLNDPPENFSTESNNPTVMEVIEKKKEDDETVETENILPRKTNLVIPPKHVIKEEIPWMKEFLKKREHKRSLIEDEKKTIEEFVKNHEITKWTKASAVEVKKLMTSYNKAEQDKNMVKNDDDNKKIENGVVVNKKSEDITTIEENAVAESKVVVNSTNFEKYTRVAETHEVATTTESTSKPNIPKRVDKKPIDLPKIDLSKIEVTNCELNTPKVDCQISAPKLPMLISDDIEDKADREKDGKNSSQIQIQELIIRIKNFEETCYKRLKNIRNEIKVVHREVASQSEFVAEFVKTLEQDLASINNKN